MKRISLYVTLICIAFGTGMSISSAATSTRSTAAPIVGTAVGENAGTLKFDYETGVPGPNEVSINAGTLDFTGTFWTQNAGWCTFGGLGGNGAKLTGTADNMPMTGFAWCENAGWISFHPTSGTDVYFTKSTGIFHGFAWSENLGWINMEGLITDITPPNLTSNFKPFAASASKMFALNDPSPVVPTGTIYTFTVDNCDSGGGCPAGTHTYTNSTPSFQHDFRQAKPYHLTITDPFGNSSEGNIQVVADVPSDTLNATNIGVTEASAYAGTFADSKVADATAVHSINLSLRDQYGNPVKSETNIKDVIVTIGFDNNVDQNQVVNSDGGDAINYGGNFIPNISNDRVGMMFSGIGRYTYGIDTQSSGDYTTTIASYAPTSIGYAFTTAANNIELKKVSYKITPLNSNIGVGEATTEVDKISKFTGNDKLNFSPALSIGTVNNSDGWTIRQGYPTTFTANLISLGTTTGFTAIRVAHILNIDSNILMSYQNPSVTTNYGTEKCHGFNEITVTFGMPIYSSNDSLCSSRSPSSNILIEPTSGVADMKFSWIPKIIIASPTNSVIKYASEISYKNGYADVKYPSYARSTDSATLADLSTVVTTNGVVNQSVKILGMTSSRNNFDVLQGNNSNKVASLTRTDIKNAIHKNVEIMTKGGATSGTKYQVYAGNQIFSTLSNKDTIIIKGGDLTIDENITNTTANIRGIIVLKDNTGAGGNIYIRKNVSNITAVLYADKSIISGDGSIYYSDFSPATQTATGQLFLKGSIISDNTIGGASMMPLKCPYNITGCDDVVAKRYDLNFFRFYDGTGTPAIGVPSAGTGYPFVIQYDNRLQTVPPPGFKMAQ